MCSHENCLIEAILMCTHNIPFLQTKIKSPQIILNLQLWDFFSLRLKNEFETAVVNEPSVLGPLKVYCSVFL